MQRAEGHAYQPFGQKIYIIQLGIETMHIYQK